MNSPVHVYIDTSGLHSGLHGNDLHKLEKLARLNSIKIMIPDMVEREFTSKSISVAEESVRQAKKALKSVGRRFKFGSDEHKRFKALLSDIVASENSISGDVLTDYQRWKEIINGETVAFSSEDVNDIIVDYFRGTGAFRSTKRRDDFPDAFIAASITRSMSIGKRGVVISNDKKLRRYFSDNDIPAYATIDDALRDVDIASKYEAIICRRSDQI